MSIDGMMDNVPTLEEMMSEWVMPDGEGLLDSIELMVQPAMLARHFGDSYTQLVSGLQYHLGGSDDTAELAELADIGEHDRVLDTCCFVGGPALQLADALRCHVTGVDISRDAVAVANRLAQMSSLDHLLDFHLCDVTDMPFEDGAFTVVWNQASLEHKESWLKEFDRVLDTGGRFAFTFQTRGRNAVPTDEPFGKWSLEDLAERLRTMNYEILHTEDISARDIEKGWKKLLKKLDDERDAFIDAFGEEWVRNAHDEFQNEIARMRAGEWGNARIVAKKLP
jgi:ubiquinone/menaquinone biosynthesis C-methylase UbiE